MVFMWCVKKWGESRHNKKIPTVVVFHNDKTKYLGSYDEELHQLRIDIKAHSGVLDLMATIIHEYTHYKQNIAENYNKYLYRYGYHRHPYEKAANRKARKHKIKALKYLLKLINK